MILKDKNLNAAANDILYSSKSAQYMNIINISVYLIKV